MLRFSIRDGLVYLHGSHQTVGIFLSSVIVEKPPVFIKRTALHRYSARKIKYVSMRNISRSFSQNRLDACPENHWTILPHDDSWTQIHLEIRSNLKLGWILFSQRKTISLRHQSIFESFIFFWFQFSHSKGSMSSSAHQLCEQRHPRIILQRSETSFQNWRHSALSAHETRVIQIGWDDIPTAQ